ncbi:hypothetical protein [Sinorhizobium fredii]|uniref:hypothetical protein n=1 Tax=Rhizobium fredii TaxID=380 RepID=UPI003399D17F
MPESMPTRQNIIRANQAELEAHGNLPHVRANTGKRGRPSVFFYLNEEQALLVCMFSPTERASQVREEVIEVYMAYRRGHLELTEAGREALPNFGNPAEAAPAWAEVWEQKNKAEAALVGAQPRNVLPRHV